MASSTRNGSSDHDEVIHLWREGEQWIAKDVTTGVASQGDSREAALDMLDDALALHERDSGDPLSPEEEREVLRDLGIDPDEVADARADADELPEFMQ